MTGPEGSTKEQAFEKFKSMKPDLFKAPSTKAPTEEPSFDPMGMPTGAMQPRQAPSRQALEFERREGPLGYAKEYGKGAMAQIAGLPAELTVNLPSNLQSLGTLAARKAGVPDLGIPEVPRAGYGVPEASKYLFGEPKGEVATGIRTAGEVLGLPGVPKMGRVAGPFEASTKLPSSPVFQGAKALEREIAPATSYSGVGKKLEEKISDRLKQLVQTRREDFEGAKNAYFEAGRKDEASILNDYKTELEKYWAEKGRGFSKDEEKLIRNSDARLADVPLSMSGKIAGTAPRNFDAIEKERRLLNDIAGGLKVEGYEAIPATFAKDLSEKLENTIKKYAPKEFEQFNQVYKTLSEPIDRYNTVLGQSVTKRAGEYLPDVSKIDPADIPDKFFKTQRSVNELKALTGDEGFVQQVAREHVANDLRNVSDAKDIRSYITKNYEWLQEMPELRAQLENVAARVKSGESVKTALKIGLFSALGAGTVSKLGKIIGD
jgi:hypothetical protein